MKASDAGSKGRQGVAAREGDSQAIAVDGGVGMIWRWSKSRRGNRMIAGYLLSRVSAKVKITQRHISRPCGCETDVPTKAYLTYKVVIVT